MNINKNTVLSFVFGMVIIATAFLGFQFFKEIQIVQQNDATLKQVVGFLNDSIKQSQAQPTTGRVVTSQPKSKE